MARGTIAKANVANKLKQIFGNDYIAENAGKHYIWSDDGGERVQIAISLTCPKTQIGEVKTGLVFGDGIDFAAAPVEAPVTAPSAEITQQELDNLANLMERLGL